MPVSFQHLRTDEDAGKYFPDSGKYSGRLEDRLGNEISDLTERVTSSGDAGGSDLFMVSVNSSSTMNHVAGKVARFLIDSGFCVMVPYMGDDSLHSGSEDGERRHAIILTPGESSKGELREWEMNFLKNRLLQPGTADKEHPPVIWIRKINRQREKPSGKEYLELTVSRPGSGRRFAEPDALLTVALLFIAIGFIASSVFLVQNLLFDLSLVLDSPALGRFVLLGSQPAFLNGTGSEFFYYTRLAGGIILALAAVLIVFYARRLGTGVKGYYAASSMLAAAAVLGIPLPYPAVSSTVGHITYTIGTPTVSDYILLHILPLSSHLYLYAQISVSTAVSALLIVALFITGHLNRYRKGRFAYLLITVIPMLLGSVDNALVWASFFSAGPGYVLPSFIVTIASYLFLFAMPATCFILVYRDLKIRREDKVALALENHWA